jgi:phospholipid transport system substrate-binding protein
MRAGKRFRCRHSCDLVEQVFTTEMIAMRVECVSFFSAFFASGRVRRAMVGAMAAFTIVLATLASPKAMAAAANPAEAFVQQNIDRGYDILNNKSLSTQQRRNQFRDFMLSLTDTRRIGMFTLGQYARGASKADTDAFVAAFSDYAIAVYESRLSKYSGQSLKVTGSIQRAPDDVVVNADVVNPEAPNAQPIHAAFRVRKNAEGRSIVTDIQIEGVWLALSERSDFTGFLQQHGGSIRALTENLHVQAEQLRNSVDNPEPAHG